MVSSDRFLSAVAIEPRIAFAKSQCNRILENPREKRPKGRDAQTRHLTRRSAHRAIRPDPGF